MSNKLHIIPNGWQNIDGRCRPIRYTKPPLPDDLSFTSREAVDRNCDSSDNDSDISECGDSTDSEE